MLHRYLSELERAMAHMPPDDPHTTPESIAALAILEDTDGRYARQRILYEQTPPEQQVARDPEMLDIGNPVRVFMHDEGYRMDLRITMTHDQATLFRRALVAFSLMPELTQSEADFLWGIIAVHSHACERLS
jgi:hypothetical protein